MDCEACVAEIFEDASVAHLRRADVVTTDRMVAYLDGRDRIVNAVEFLRAAHNHLNKIPRLSDNCATLMIEINSCIYHLNEELRDLEKKNAKTQ